MISASATRTNAGIAVHQSVLHAEIAATRRALQFTRDALDKALMSNAKILKESNEKTEIILDLKDRIEELEVMTGSDIVFDKLTPVSAIIARVAFVRNVTPEQMTGKIRSRLVSYARMEAMYETYRLRHDLGMVAIGREFNNCHTTVHYAIEQWPKRAAVLGLKIEPIIGRGVPK